MAMSERAIILSDLRLGGAPLSTTLKDLLGTLGPQTELVLCGVPPQDVAALGPALPAGVPVTILGGPPRPEEEELLPGLRGRRLFADAGVQVWVTTVEAMGCPTGPIFDQLLRWRPLRGFVRAWSRQLQSHGKLPEAEGPEQHVAQALARALYEAQGKEEQALLELGNFLDGAQEAASPLLAGLIEHARALLQDVTIALCRRRASQAAAVVLGGGPARYVDGQAPIVVLTGSASGDTPTWVEVTLAGPLKIEVRDKVVVAAAAAVPSQQEQPDKAPQQEQPDKAAPQQDAVAAQDEPNLQDPQDRQGKQTKPAKQQRQQPKPQE